MAKSTKQRGLGRGLSSLMSDIAETEQPETPSRSGETRIAIDLIAPNPDQPRRDFSDEALSELASSIKAKGVIQPLILRQDPNKPDHYQIVAGERRWRASQIAGLHELPAIVRDFDDTEVLEVAIIENIQRADLNAIEEAEGYRQLMDRFGHTQEKLAEAMGKSRSHIANLMRLLTLPEDVRKSVIEGKLSSGHARTLVGRDDASDLAREIMSKGLSVRGAEALARKKPGGSETKTPPKRKAAKDADTVAIERELSAHLKMKVSIDADKSGEAGRVTVGYKDLEQLDDLLRLLSGE